MSDFNEFLSVYTADIAAASWRGAAFLWGDATTWVGWLYRSFSWDQHQTIVILTHVLPQIRIAGSRPLSCHLLFFSHAATTLLIHPEPHTTQGCWALQRLTTASGKVLSGPSSFRWKPKVTLKAFLVAVESLWKAHGCCTQPQRTSEHRQRLWLQQASCGSIAPPGPCDPLDPLLGPPLASMSFPWEGDYLIGPIYYSCNPLDYSKHPPSPH